MKLDIHGVRTPWNRGFMASSGLGVALSWVGGPAREPDVQGLSAGVAGGFGWPRTRGGCEWWGHRFGRGLAGHLADIARRCMDVKWPGRHRCGPLPADSRG